MTAQIHEEVIYDGEKTSMAFCPPIPGDHPRIVKVDPREAVRTGGGCEIFSTACWRGYLGTWEIRDGRFYLRKLRGMYEVRGREPILADWFTGVLRIPRGELLHYVHMGFGSVYEEEVHVKVERGVVTSTRVVDNRGQAFDSWELGLRNLPGGENRFPGDDEE